MSAHHPLSALANATVASSGTCHCYPEWHNFPVYIMIVAWEAIIVNMRTLLFAMKGIPYDASVWCGCRLLGHVSPELSTVCDPAGDFLKMNQSGYTKLATSLIWETFDLVCHMQFYKSLWLVMRISLISPDFRKFWGYKCWQLWYRVIAGDLSQTLCINLWLLYKWLFPVYVTFV